MIVYRNVTRTVDTRSALARLRVAARRAKTLGTPAHDDLVSLLIEIGALDSAVTDALAPDCDHLPAASMPLLGATLAAARAVRVSWAGAEREAMHGAVEALDRALARVALRSLPEQVAVGVAEGYAYYALSPEMYLASAARLLDALRPAEVACVGIRSIGTSLAAVVAAEAEARGCRVHLMTVRPRGHPFDRRVVFGPAAAAELRGRAAALHVIVDEGPGLSGSSFASAARALHDLGVSESRIVLCPSWEPDGEAFVNEPARRSWRAHRKFAASFEDTWLAGDRLARAFGTEPRRWRDLSAGAWRSVLLPAATDWPAVQPQHERRKYLDAGSHDSPPRLIKFAGLGARGLAQQERAAALFIAGFGPRPVALAHGFLSMEWVRGARPLSAAGVDRSLLETVARYLALRRELFRTGEPADSAALTEMVMVNAAHAVPSSTSVAALHRFERRAAESGGEPAIALDAHLFPHEWVRGGEATIKTDALEHDDDHFYPGPQDVAWDVAAACIELAPSAHASAFLIARYRQVSGDAGIAARVGVYRIAYLAHRFGYATLATTATAGTADSARWAAAAARYRRFLARDLDQWAHAA